MILQISIFHGNLKKKNTQEALFTQLLYNASDFSHYIISWFFSKTCLFYTSATSVSLSFIVLWINVFIRFGAHKPIGVSCSHCHTGNNLCSSVNYLDDMSLCVKSLHSCFVILDLYFVLSQTWFLFWDMWQCVEFVIAVYLTLSQYDNKLDLIWTLSIHLECVFCVIALVTNIVFFH